MWRRCLDCGSASKSGSLRVGSSDPKSRKQRRWGAERAERAESAATAGALQLSILARAKLRPSGCLKIMFIVLNCAKAIKIPPVLDVICP